jgi:hypothetical protein
MDLQIIDHAHKVGNELHSILSYIHEANEFLCV